MINSLPIELVSQIQGYLPSYQFRGKNAVGSVQKRWKQAQNMFDAATVNKSIEAIVESCKTPEDVVFILKDSEFFKQLSFKQQLEIIAHHPEIATKVLQDAKELIKSDHIAILGSKSLTVAQTIMNTPDLLKRLHNYGKAALGSAHFAIAERMLNEPELGVNEDTPTLCSLVRAHFSIAQKLLNKREYQNSAILSAIGQAHESLAWEIFNTPELLAKLNCLAKIGADHQSIGEHILNTTELCQKLTHPISIGLLGEKNPVLAKRILNTPELRSRLDSHALSLLAKPHTLVAEQILKDPHWNEMITNDFLAGLCCHHFALAPQIFNDPRFKNVEAVALQIIVLEQPFLAKLMLATPDLRNKLNARALSDLGKARPSIAKLILSEDDLQSKLDNEDLVAMSENYSTAMLILANEKLKAKLSAAECEEASRVIEINEIISNAHQLVAMPIEPKEQKLMAIR